MNIKWRRVGLNTAIITVVAHIIEVLESGACSFLWLAALSACVIATIFQLYRERVSVQYSTRVVLTALGCGGLVVGNIVLIAIGQASRWSDLAIFAGTLCVLALAFGVKMTVVENV